MRHCDGMCCICLCNPCVVVRYKLFLLRGRWVPGELLQFGGAHPVLRGAELGFLWAAPGEQRYLILFSRINLESPKA